MEEGNQMSWLLWTAVIIFLVWFILDFFRKNNYYEGLENKYFPGNPCTLNDQCTTNACGSFVPGDSTMTCCPSDNTILFGARTYCSKLPNNERCFLNSQCASNKCEGDICKP